MNGSGHSIKTTVLFAREQQLTFTGGFPFQFTYILFPSSLCPVSTAISVLLYIFTHIASNAQQGAGLPDPRWRRTGWTSSDHTGTAECLVMMQLDSRTLFTTVGATEPIESLLTGGRLMMSSHKRNTEAPRDTGGVQGQGSHQAFSFPKMPNLSGRVGFGRFRDPRVTFKWGCC